MKSGNSQLVRNTLARVLTIALLALVAVGSAFAQVPTVNPPGGINPGTDVGDQGMFLPHGLIRVPVLNAAGAVILDGAGNPRFDYWVADTASGFCRLDPAPNPATGATSGALNLSTCFLNATGAPQDYQVEFGVVFVADMSTGGVMRFKFKPAGDNLHMVLDLANSVQIFGPSSLIGSVPVGIHPRVEVAKMGPDGKLYITFPGNGDIWRILNPLSPTFTPAGNKAERVGTSDNGRRIDALGWIGNDLWMDQAGFLNRLQNATTCNYTAKCAALLEFGLLQTNTGMASDAIFSTNVTGHHLYFSSGNTIADYDTNTNQTMNIVSNSGNLISGPGGATTLVPTSLVLGLNLDQATGDFLYVDDPIIEAPGPAIPVANQRTGRAWVLKAGPIEPCGPSQTCSLTSQVGTDAPPVSLQQQAAARRSILVLAGVTHPRGLIFLGNHYWVSDEVSGFCRVDINPATNAASLTNCYKPNATFIPGQADADLPAPVSNTRNLYVPDASGNPGLARFKFNPAGNGGNGSITQTGLLSTGTNAVEAVAVPKPVAGFAGPLEDAVYLGFSNNGQIFKITGASTAPSALIPVANTENGVGIVSMAFNGTDLYMAEEGTPVLQNGNVNSVKRGSFNTLIPKASPSMAKGTAVSVAFPVVRGQFLGLIVQNPLAIAMGPEFERPLCLGPPGVATGFITSYIPGDVTTAPSMYVGASAFPTPTLPGSPQGGNLTPDAEVDQWSFTCKTQSNWVDQGSISPLIALNLPLSNVTAIAVSGNVSNASMMIGDDPTAQVPDPRGGGPTDPLGIPLTARSPIPGQGKLYLVP